MRTSLARRCYRLVLEISAMKPLIRVNMLASAVAAALFGIGFSSSAQSAPQHVQASNAVANVADTKKLCEITKLHNLISPQNRGKNTGKLFKAKKRENKNIFALSNFISSP